MRLKKTLKLYRMYISIVLRSSLQYKLSFLLMMIGRFILSFSGFLGIFFLFSGFKDIKGYSYSDILLCYAILQLSFAITECIGSGFGSFSGTVKRGEFDRILLRPCSPILQVLGTRFELGRIGPMVTAVFMLLIGIQHSAITWSISRVLTLVFMVIGGIVLFLGLFMIDASICFFTIEDTRSMNMFTYGAKEHGKYPFDIYGKGIMRFCTYVIPYTMVQYYPLQYLIGKSQHWVYMLYPFASIVFFIICYGIWRFGMKHYESCGS